MERFHLHMRDVIAKKRCEPITMAGRPSSSLLLCQMYFNVSRIIRNQRIFLQA